jgi:uncharacterized protein (DUF2062 family)
MISLRHALRFFASAFFDCRLIVFRRYFAARFSRFADYVSPRLSFRQFSAHCQMLLLRRHALRRHAAAIARRQLRHIATPFSPA